jgi:hypothetical protein
MIKLKDLKVNEDNPRSITGDAMEKLCKSIERDKKFMELRPIVVDEDNHILGGNQRYKACIKLGMEEIPNKWIKKAGDLTEEEKKRFIVVDNAPEGMTGEWDLDTLIDNYDNNILIDLGFEDLVSDVEIPFLDDEDLGDSASGNFRGGLKSFMISIWKYGIVVKSDDLFEKLESFVNWYNGKLEEEQERIDNKVSKAIIRVLHEISRQMQ